MSLQCLFCFSTQFELPEEDYQPQPGEQIKCANCGRMNDYDSELPEFVAYATRRVPELESALKTKDCK